MKEKKIVSIIVFVLLMLGITIGYSILSTSLSINGTSNIHNSTWNIHFENLQVKSGSVAASIPTISSNRTVVTYSVELDKPGDYYEFTVDVKNDGTIDGMIESVTSKLNNEVITSLPEYLEYYVIYDDGIEIVNNQLLRSNTKETIKVFVGYKKDIDSSVLPSSEQVLEFQLNMNYSQSTSDAFEVRTYKYGSTYNHLFVPGTEPHSDLKLYDSLSEFREVTKVNFANKIYLVNNKVVTCGISFFHNDHEYYLAGGDGGAAYNINKSILDEVFGSNNCTYNSTNQFYSCENGPLQIGYFGFTVYLNGKLNGSDYFNNIFVNETGICGFSS